MKKKILVTFGTETLFIHMNGCQILLFQNEENEKDTNFTSLIFLGLMVFFIHMNDLHILKPSFALAPQAHFYLAT